MLVAVMDGLARPPCRKGRSDRRGGQCLRRNGSSRRAASAASARYGTVRCSPKPGVHCQLSLPPETATGQTHDCRSVFALRLQNSRIYGSRAMLVCVPCRAVPFFPGPLLRPAARAHTPRMPTLAADACARTHTANCAEQDRREQGRRVQVDAVARFTPQIRRLHQRPGWRCAARVARVVGWRAKRVQSLAG